MTEAKTKKVRRTEAMDREYSAGFTDGDKAVRNEMADSNNRSFEHGDSVGYARRAREDTAKLQTEANTLVAVRDYLTDIDRETRYDALDRATDAGAQGFYLVDLAREIYNFVEGVE